MVKRTLKKSIGKSLLSIEEMTTVITEVEAVINCRPLTYLYNDIEDGSPLTPAHMLCGKRLVSVPDGPKYKDEIDDPDFTPVSTKKDISKRLKIRNANIQNFWSCWRKEYLVNLRENDQVKSTRSKDPLIPEVGDVILLGDQIPRSQWRLAKIVQLIRGKDEVVRAAQIKTSNGMVLQRAIQHLYPMEIHDKEIAENDSVVSIKDNEIALPELRPTRESAIEAKRKIHANFV